MRLFVTFIIGITAGSLVATGAWPLALLLVSGYILIRLAEWWFA